MPAKFSAQSHRNGDRNPLPRRLLAWAMLLSAALAAAGCGTRKPYEFVVNLEGRDPASVQPEQKEAVEKTLQQLFGTPDQPKVPEGVNLDPNLLAMAAGPVGGDAEGNQRGLFRRHCVMCHGISGDGAGPAARTCVPYSPRDFRRGIFKYTSTRGGAKPVKADLRRTLLRGLSGTSMPSFIQLRSDEIDALVEYVKYLSIRGEAEQYLLRLIVDDMEPEELPSLSMADVMDNGVLPAARSWEELEKDPGDWVVTPPPRPTTRTREELQDSIAQGRALYLTKEAQCVKCHGKEGNGKGEETELYDDWNKPKLGDTPEETARRAALFRMPLEKLQPRDFRQGIFHGGARPEDLYLRIAVGIKGTPMPAAGESPGVKAVLKPEEIWHIVDYLRALAAGDEATKVQLSSANGTTQAEGGRQQAPGNH